MRLSNAFVVLSLVVSAFAQVPAKPDARAATVPVTLDHDRVVIDVYLPLPDGTTKRVRGWVDNGNPDLYLSRHAAGRWGSPLLATRSCARRRLQQPSPLEN